MEHVAYVLKLLSYIAYIPSPNFIECHSSHCRLCSIQKIKLWLEIVYELVPLNMWHYFGFASEFNVLQVISCLCFDYLVIALIIL
jgi:hypothetical protein